MLEALETAQYFDRHAARYDELIGTVSFQVDDAYDYLARYITGAWEGKNPVRILELGIGTGLLTRHLLQTNSAAIVTGIDGSSGMLERARQNLQAHTDACRSFTASSPTRSPKPSTSASFPRSLCHFTASNTQHCSAKYIAY